MEEPLRLSAPGRGHRLLAATAPFCSYEAMGPERILQTSGLLAALCVPQPPHCPEATPCREHPHHIAGTATFPRDHSLMVGSPPIVEKPTPSLSAPTWSCALPSLADLSSWGHGNYSRPGVRRLRF